MGPVNYDKEPIRVNHADLFREDDNSAYRSSCPRCDLGILFVHRDQETFVLQAEDRCVVCGQKFIYEDIEKMRARER